MIKYTNVINSYIGTETKNGITTNYMYYTILVVDTDGTSQIVEGRLNQVSFYLKFVRTPVDEIMELKEIVRGLRQNINDIVDQKMKVVVDSLYPIPDILNRNEREALSALKEAGLTPILDNEYPEGTPANGIVRAFSRNPENFKQIHLSMLRLF